MNKNSTNLICCNYCDSCDYCNYCDSCNSCDFCYYCNSCDFCDNLKMTEYNLFCYSKQYNDENSFQQKRYRAFNKEVGKDKYYQLLGKCRNILGSPKKQLKDFWKDVTKTQWKQLMELAEEVRGDNFKEGFEFISGIKTEEKMIEIKGKKYSEDTICEAMKKYVNE